MMKERGIDIDVISIGSTPVCSVANSFEGAIEIHPGIVNRLFTLSGEATRYVFSRLSNYLLNFFIFLVISIWVSITCLFALWHFLLLRVFLNVEML